jgi:hypothetical protein
VSGTSAITGTATTAVISGGIGSQGSYQRLSGTNLSTSGILGSSGSQNISSTTGTSITSGYTPGQYTSAIGNNFTATSGATNTTTGLTGTSISNTTGSSGYVPGQYVSSFYQRKN